MEEKMKRISRKERMMNPSFVEEKAPLAEEIFDLALSDAPVIRKIDGIVQTWTSLSLTEEHVEETLKLLPLQLLMDVYHDTSAREDQQVIERFICLCVENSQRARDAVLANLRDSSHIPLQGVLSILESCALMELSPCDVHTILQLCLSDVVWRMPSESVRVLYRVSKSLFEMADAIALRNTLNKLVDMWLDGHIRIEGTTGRSEFGKMVASIATVVFRRIAIVNDRVQPFPVSKWQRFLLDFGLEFKLPKITGLPVRVHDTCTLPFKWKQRLAE